MSEIIDTNIDLYPRDSVYGQLGQLRISAEEKGGVPAHMAITKDVHLPEGSSVKFCLGARDPEGEQEDLMFIRIGKDLSDPDAHEWIAASKSGVVFRYDHRMKDFSPIESSDDIKEVQLLVDTINRQFNNINT